MRCDRVWVLWRGLFAVAGIVRCDRVCVRRQGLCAVTGFVRGGGRSQRQRLRGGVVRLLSLRPIQVGRRAAGARRARHAT